MLAELINSWSYFFAKLNTVRVFFIKFDMELEIRPSHQESLGEPTEQPRARIGRNRDIFTLETVLQLKLAVNSLSVVINSPAFSLHTAPVIV